MDQSKNHESRKEWEAKVVTHAWKISEEQLLLAAGGYDASVNSYNQGQNCSCNNCPIQTNALYSCKKSLGSG